MTAAQRMLIGKALGPGVLQAAEQIQFCLNTYGKADAALWRDFLQKLWNGAGDEVMNSPLGLAMQIAIQGRIQGDNNGNDASVSSIV